MLSKTHQLDTEYHNFKEKLFRILQTSRDIYIRESEHITGRIEYLKTIVSGILESRTVELYPEKVENKLFTELVVKGDFEKPRNVE